MDCTFIPSRIITSSLPLRRSHKSLHKKLTCSHPKPNNLVGVRDFVFNQNEEFCYLKALTLLLLTRPFLACRFTNYNLVHDTCHTSYIHCGHTFNRPMNTRGSSMSRNGLRRSIDPTRPTQCPFCAVSRCCKPTEVLQSYGGEKTVDPFIKRGHKPSWNDWSELQIMRV